MACDDTLDRTFRKPSQSKNPDNSANSAKLIKSEMCDFQCVKKTDLRNHKETNHNWFHFCYSSFDCKKKLTTHTNDIHSED